VTCARTAPRRVSRPPRQCARRACQQRARQPHRAGAPLWQERVAHDVKRDAARRARGVRLGAQHARVPQPGVRVASQRRVAPRRQRGRRPQEVEADGHRQQRRRVRGDKAAQQGGEDALQRRVEGAPVVRILRARGGERKQRLLLRARERRHVRARRRARVVVCVVVCVVVVAVVLAVLAVPRRRSSRTLGAPHAGSCACPWCAPVIADAASARCKRVARRSPAAVERVRLVLQELTGVVCVSPRAALRLVRVAPIHPRRSRSRRPLRGRARHFAVLRAAAPSTRQRCVSRAAAAVLSPRRAGCGCGSSSGGATAVRRRRVHLLPGAHAGVSPPRLHTVRVATRATRVAVPARTENARGCPQERAKQKRETGCTGRGRRPSSSALS
jgi:hypothetical protein